jgi:hypothetical protein
VKPAPFVEIQVVIAAPGPIAVAVDQHIVERQEPERAIDVQDRRERPFELVRRCRVQDPGQADQRVPGPPVVPVPDLEQPLVGFGIVAGVLEARAAARIARYLPAYAVLALESVGDEVAIDLFETGTSTSVFRKSASSCSQSGESNSKKIVRTVPGS